MDSFGISVYVNADESMVVCKHALHTNPVVVVVIGCVLEHNNTNNNKQQGAPASLFHPSRRMV